MTGGGDDASRPVDEESAAARQNDPDGVIAPDEKPRPDDDAPETMQHDHDSAVGRQRYGDARGGTYSRDFQADESGTHPVKETPEGATDERGIPDIAATEPPEGEK